MKWYAVYDKNTGALYSVGSVVEPSKLPAVFECKEIPKPDAASQWNSLARAFEQHTPPPPVTIEERIAELEKKIDRLLEVKQ